MLNSSLYVMTSLTESFGLVLIEANSYGIPCIAFDSASGAKQIIENKELLISNRDKETSLTLLSVHCAESRAITRRRKGSPLKSSAQTASG